MNIRFNSEISLSMRGFRLDWKQIWEIYQIGIPSIIMQCIGSIMTLGMNLIFMQLLHSSTATAVFGVYFKLQSFVFMPLFGLNNGMVPIISYNYGAGHKTRILDTYRLSRTSGMILMSCGTVIFLLFPRQLLGLFHASEEMIRIGVPALRIICLNFAFAGYSIITGSVLQALGNAVYTMINSICRQIVILLPSAFLLALFWGFPAVWWCMNIAEVSSVLLTTIFYRKIYREKISLLPD